MSTAAWPSTPERRNQIAERLDAEASTLTTVAMQRFATDISWFRDLDAEHRSWVSFVARAGIDAFINWLRLAGEGVTTRQVFDVAPRALTRFITLQQTVDLVRTTIDTVEASVDDLVAATDRDTVQMAIILFAREIAFGAAVVYARAAEMRGLWDERLESFVVDAVIRGEAEESVLARATALGWHDPKAVVVVIGPGRAGVAEVRDALLESEFSVLASPQGDRAVVVIGGNFDSQSIQPIIANLATHFSDGPIVIGEVVPSLAHAYLSARGALSGARAAAAWPAAPRPVTANDLLPERALAGDGHARRKLAREVFGPLREAHDPLITLEAFFENGESIEATARALFIHANTVRYRLKRVAEITGFSPTQPRDAYALRIALTLGRLIA